ncbi:MAG: ATP-dependent RNA helicase HrpA [Gammaproteobacteria bacterium]|nr:ATP-dependent RNA helicase HrpA [Gammaproteobacteria bacterium]
MQGQRKPKRSPRRPRSHPAPRNLTPPTPSFPAELPITERIDEVVDLIRRHPVVVVAGETGSGKTTQLPKACLAAGLGRKGVIGHTQPRRLAARTVAARIAQELEVPLGADVGYAVRFSERLSEKTCVKVMTDGLLLTEIQQDQRLRRYEAIIVDEAHERSLNVDLLLGHLKRLVGRRSDLKVLITSATIDVAAFSNHFGDAPVVEVSGRGYPVDVAYREPSDNSLDALGGCLEEIDSGKARSGARDVLVFQTGEREIFDTSHWLRRRFGDRFDILPLYARLPPKEQQRVFAPGGRRRIVLATNVAETSITVPNIGFVVDPGLARISRYSYRSKLQRLPIEAISQASAAQRAGRCGRVAPGVCFRLYDETDFEARPAYTDPELKRTNLASVVLTMRAFRLGDISTFPFLDPPDPRAVRDAVRLLHELGALRPASNALPSGAGRPALAGTRRARKHDDVDDELTDIGRTMARIPVDPRLARMLIEASRRGCLTEVSIVVAGLAVQDPRLRPLDRRDAADEAHRAFADDSSDFLAYVNLWRWLETTRDATTRSGFRRELERRFLSPVRVGEWRALHRQLLLSCKRLGMRFNTADADYQGVHRALIAGSLSFAGMKDDTAKERFSYAGARDLSFRIFPGSALSNRRPKWIVAAEISDTGRTYARCVAAVEPRWLEEAAGHLLRRSFSDPEWDAARGEAIVRERATLYGLPVVNNRARRLAEINAAQARDIFVREALVRGDASLKAPFLTHNQRLIRQVLARQDKARRTDLLAPEPIRTAFYLERLPDDIVGVKSFEAWLRRASPTSVAALEMTEADLVTSVQVHLAEDAFPGRLQLAAGGEAKLRYRFAPGTPDDGITAELDSGLLANAHPEDFEWLVPGFLEEKCTLLLRSLPKSARRRLGPIPDCVQQLMPVLLSKSLYRQERLTQALAQVLGSVFNVTVSPGDWHPERLPPHLAVNVRVLGPSRGRGRRGKHRVLDEDRDLAALKQRLLARVEQHMADGLRETHEREALTEFPAEGVPRQRIARTEDGQSVVYPVLVDRGATVDLLIQSSSKGQGATNRRGLARLALLAEGRASRKMRREVESDTLMPLHFAPLGTMAELVDEVLRATAWQTFFEDRPQPETRQDFDERLAAASKELPGTFQRILELARSILARRFAVAGVLERLDSPAYRAARADMESQLTEIAGKDFLSATPGTRLADIPRYLDGMEWRGHNLQGRIQRDQQGIETLARWQSRLATLREATGETETTTDLRFLLQELRITLFSQRTGTREKVSEVRLERLFQPAERAAGLR